MWLQPGGLTLEYGGETLSAYDVEMPPGSGKPRAIEGARLYETSYGRSRPQKRLFALDEVGWPKALELDGYAPRRPRGPLALQGVLFPYLDAL